MRRPLDIFLTIALSWGFLEIGADPMGQSAETALMPYFASRLVQDVERALRGICIAGAAVDGRKGEEFAPPLRLRGLLTACLRQRNASR